MAGHTPGPWEIDTLTRPAEICTVHHVPTQPTEDRKGQGWIYIRGAIGYWDADEDEQMANAYLIAAAPDLFDACVEFVRKFESGEARSKRSYAQMKDAIAKARGES